ncbi:MAG: ABC transporter [Pelagibacterium sp. SCN 64-44]|nr:MAG: ABC transporter [Pelagibacterium sp. SCN 64-44]
MDDMLASRIEVKNLTLSYGQDVILDALSLPIPSGRITVLAGPNGCGKSTLLRAIRRLHAPQSGQVLLDALDISRLNGKELGRRIGLLAQSPTAPQDMSVEELVRLGRYPHQAMLQPWSPRDDAAVAAAMAGTGVEPLRHRRIGSLSGGQLQRAWIAMVLAQETDIICLDEPVNHLDMAHQLECLELVTRLNKEQGRTIVLVLHDLNLAARYADQLVFVSGGKIRDSGPAEAMMRSDLIAEVFNIGAEIITDPVHHRPMCIPFRRQ